MEYFARSGLVMAGDYAAEGEPDVLIEVQVAEEPAALACDIALKLNAFDAMMDALDEAIALIEGWDAGATAKDYQRVVGKINDAITKARGDSASVSFSLNAGGFVFQSGGHHYATDDAGVVHAVHRPVKDGRHVRRTLCDTEVPVMTAEQRFDGAREKLPPEDVTCPECLAAITKISGQVAATGSDEAWKAAEERTNTFAANLMAQKMHDRQRRLCISIEGLKGEGITSIQHNRPFVFRGLKWALYSIDTASGLVTLESVPGD